jgi:hypothetical protein
MMTMPPRKTLKENIRGYATMVKDRIHDGYEAHLMTFVFNQLRGGLRQMNQQMQNQIENVYASLITRLHRRPHAAGVTHPILIGCPDLPVTKYQKKSLPEVITNDGLHYHGLLLVPPGSSRMKVSIQQHFTENQSYYLRDRVLSRIDVRPITHDIDHVTDYALKGLKANRLHDEETLLILPKTSLEISVRPYRPNPQDQ